MKRMLCVCTGALTAAAAFGNNWYFSPDGDDANYGNVRTAPRKSVNAWIETYRFGSGDTIYLLPGVHDRINWGYHGESVLKINFVGIKADGTPADRNEVVLTGGGTNTCCRMIYKKDFSFRNITFRDGVGDGCNGGALNGKDKNNAAWTSTSTIISNCVFESCSSTGTGGAVWLQGGSPVIMDCVFSNCQAAASGAMSLSSCTSTVAFVRCTFDSNAATNGNAGAVTFGHNGTETVTFGARLVDCVFTNNSASALGGAFQGLVEYATNTVFAANRSGTHGGVWYYNGYASGLAGDYTLTNTFVGCTFAENRAGANGGVFSYHWPKRFRFASCDFLRNGSDASGGVLQADADMRGFVRAEDCRFEGNRAKSSGCFGFNTTFTDTVLRGCTFVGNAATNGSFGVMSAGYVGAETNMFGYALADCVFSNNTATADGGVLGGVVHFATNCVFACNRAVRGGVFYHNGYASSTYSGCYTLTNAYVDCRFESNAAEKGALFATEWTKRFRFERCTVKNNAATTAGTFFHGSNIFDIHFALVDCDVVGNGGASMFSRGSAVSVQTGYTQVGLRFLGTAFRDNTVCICENDGIPVIIDRCRFTGNTGTRVISLDGSSASAVRNCLFAGNTSTAANGGVIGLEWQTARKVAFENNTVVDNVSAAAPYGVWTDSWCTENLGNSYTNNVFHGNRGPNGATGSQVPAMIDWYAANCWFETGASSIANGTRGNIVGTDPGFVTARHIARYGAPAYMPARSSPLRRKGALLAWMDAAARDAAGNPRVEEGTVDIGCYQSLLPQDGTFLVIR